MDDVKVVDVCSEKRRTSTICYRVPFPDTLLSRWQIETRAAVTAEHCSWDGRNIVQLEEIVRMLSVYATTLVPLLPSLQDYSRGVTGAACRTRCKADKAEACRCFGVTSYSRLREGSEILKSHLSGQLLLQLCIWLLDLIVCSDLTKAECSQDLNVLVHWFVMIPHMLGDFDPLQCL